MLAAGHHGMPNVPASLAKFKASAVHVVAKGRQDASAANSVQVLPEMLFVPFHLLHIMCHTRHGIVSFRKHNKMCFIIYHFHQSTFVPWDAFIDPIDIFSL